MLIRPLLFCNHGGGRFPVARSVRCPAPREKARPGGRRTNWKLLTGTASAAQDVVRPAFAAPPSPALRTSADLFAKYLQ